MASAGIAFGATPLLIAQLLGAAELSHLSNPAFWGTAFAVGLVSNFFLYDFIRQGAGESYSLRRNVDFMFFLSTLTVLVEMFCLKYAPIADPTLGLALAVGLPAVTSVSAAGAKIAIDHINQDDVPNRDLHDPNRDFEQDVENYPEYEPHDFTYALLNANTFCASGSKIESPKVEPTWRKSHSTETTRLVS